jgi:protein translocase SEC61 complex gamma subunit
MTDIVDLVRRCIMGISRKPTKEEYEKVAKVTAMGIILIGTIGLITSVIFSLI